MNVMLSINQVGASKKGAEDSFIFQTAVADSVEVKRESRLVFFSILKKQILNPSPGFVLILISVSLSPQSISGQRKFAYRSIKVENKLLGTELPWEFIFVYFVQINHFQVYLQGIFFYSNV